MKQCVVAVDVGNSAIKLCVRQHQGRDQEPTFIDHSIRIDQAGWDLSAIHWVKDQLGCKAVQWRIASVHRSAADQLGRSIEVAQPDAVIDRITRHAVPMEIFVDHPDQLGIDRLLGAHAACNRFAAPLVIVDAGSAVTIDWVNSRGEFHGGAILPGVSLQLSVLATGTDALPQIDWRQTESLRVPGKNTSEAIRLGVLTGIAATIDRLARWYASEAGINEMGYTLVVTGGDAPVISPLLTHSHQVVENLVCRGLLDLPRSILSSPNSLSSPNREQELE